MLQGCCQSWQPARASLLAELGQKAAHPGHWVQATLCQSHIFKLLPVGARCFARMQINVMVGQHLLLAGSSCSPAHRKSADTCQLPLISSGKARACLGALHPMQTLKLVGWPETEGKIILGFCKPLQSRDDLGCYGYARKVLALLIPWMSMCPLPE